MFLQIIVENSIVYGKGISTFELFLHLFVFPNLQALKKNVYQNQLCYILFVLLQQIVSLHTL